MIIDPGLVGAPKSSEASLQRCSCNSFQAGHTFEHDAQW